MAIRQSHDWRRSFSSGDPCEGTGSTSGRPPRRSLAFGSLKLEPALRTSSWWEHPLFSARPGSWCSSGERAEPLRERPPPMSPFLCRPLLAFRPFRSALSVYTWVRQAAAGLSSFPVPCFAFPASLEGCGSGVQRGGSGSALGDAAARGFIRRDVQGCGCLSPSSHVPTARVHGWTPLARSERMSCSGDCEPSARKMAENCHESATFCHVVPWLVW